LGIDCPVEGRAVMRMEKHEYFGKSTITVEDVVGRVLCDIEEPI
jgi:hypothetical protein